MDKYDKLKLENQLCFSLYAASREVIKLYKPLLDKFNLTYTQYLVLLVLWEEKDCTVKLLGEKLHLDSGTLSPLIKKLEKMELITKYRDVQDDRVVHVTLTEKAEQLKETILEVPEQMYCKFNDQMGELGQLKILLDGLIQNLDE